MEFPTPAMAESVTDRVIPASVSLQAGKAARNIGGEPAFSLWKGGSVACSSDVHPLVGEMGCKKSPKCFEDRA
ncbi:unnamed protein product [Victoria cruziana]